MRFKLRHISRYEGHLGLFLNLCAPFSPSFNSFGSTKKHFQKWNASFEGAVYKAKLLTFHSISGEPPPPGRMRAAFLEIFRVDTERADTSESPDTTCHSPCCMTRLCTVCSSASCVTIVPTVSWRKLVPISAGSAQTLWRGGRWFGETVDGCGFCFLAVFINSRDPCKYWGSLEGGWL